MALKLNEQGYDILKDELTKCEGPFSKTQNVMLALDLMAKGEELSSTQVTKAHLSNIIKLLCVKLRWNEEPLEVKNEETNDSGEYTEKNEEVEKNSSHVSNVMKNSEKLCRFYKRGQCKYGKSGKTKDQNGKICVFSHPPTCKKFELFGYKEGGCKDKKCSKIHLSLCNSFMKNENCSYGEQCKFFRPRKLKNNTQDKKVTSGQTERSENITYAQVLKSNNQPQIQTNEQSPFLGHPQYAQQPVIFQENQFQQPTVGQRNNMHQVFLDLQSGQKHMMQMFMTLNQKLMNLEKYNLQMQKL